MGKARKGGGIFHRPIMSSSAGMFARKGDPWVTGREGERDYNRQVEVENPDMDADRQRHARISRFSKEFQDRVHKPIDAKMTMREAIETERSVRLDGYQAEKAFKPKPQRGKWPERGKDFQVATVQRRLVGVAIRTRREVNALEGKNTTNIISGGKMSSTAARVNTTARIGCPRGCGLVVTDSRLISKHLQKFKNSCCTHGHCNCEDCKRARND